MKNLFLIFAFVSFSYGIAQVPQVDDLLNKSIKTYDKSVYKLDLKYNLYGTHTSSDVIESYSGSYILDHKNSYLSINNTITINNGVQNKGVKIYKDEEKIETFSTSNIADVNPIDISKFLKYFKDRTIEDMGNYYRCTLISGVITQLPFGKVVLEIDKESYHIKKQVLFFLNAVTYKDQNAQEKQGNPRLEVQLNNYKTQLSKSQKQLFNLSNYTSNNTAVGEYKSYKVVKL